MVGHEKKFEFPSRGFWNSGDTLLNSVFFLRLPCLISFLCQGNELSEVSPELPVTALLVEAIKELKAETEVLKGIICEEFPDKPICQDSSEKEM